MHLYKEIATDHMPYLNASHPTVAQSIWNQSSGGSTSARIISHSQPSVAQSIWGRQYMIWTVIPDDSCSKYVIPCQESKNCSRRSPTWSTIPVINQDFSCSYNPFVCVPGVTGNYYHMYRSCRCQWPNKKYRHKAPRQNMHGEIKSPRLRVSVVL